jgi:chemotaxis protein histidine kinase CheA
LIEERLKSRESAVISRAVLAIALAAAPVFAGQISLPQAPANPTTNDECDALYAAYMQIYYGLDPEFTQALGQAAQVETSAGHSAAQPYYARAAAITAEKDDISRQAVAARAQCYAQVRSYTERQAMLQAQEEQQRQEQLALQQRQMAAAAQQTQQATQSRQQALEAAYSRQEALRAQQSANAAQTNSMVATFANMLSSAANDDSASQRDDNETAAREAEAEEAQEALEARQLALAAQQAAAEQARQAEAARLAAEKAREEKAAHDAAYDSLLGSLGSQISANVKDALASVNPFNSAGENGANLGSAIDKGAMQALVANTDGLGKPGQSAYADAVDSVGERVMNSGNPFANVVGTLSLNGGTTVMRQITPMASAAAQDASSITVAGVAAAAGSPSQYVPPPPSGANPFASQGGDVPPGSAPANPASNVPPAYQVPNGYTLYRELPSSPVTTLPLSTPNLATGDTVDSVGNLQCTSNGAGIVLPACEAQRQAR